MIYFDGFIFMYYNWSSFSYDIVCIVVVIFEFNCDIICFIEKYFLFLGEFIFKLMFKN